MSQSDTFYIRFRGRTTGPYSRDDLARMVKRGQVTRMHQVSLDQSEWQRVSELDVWMEHVGSKEEAAASGFTSSATSSASGGDTGGSEHAHHEETTGDATATIPDRNWYVAVNNQEIGPLISSKVIEMIHAGQINGTTLVWFEGASEWTNLNQTELGAVLGSESSDGTPAPQTFTKKRAGKGGRAKAKPWLAIAGISISLSLVAIIVVAIMMTQSSGKPSRPNTLGANVVSSPQRGLNQDQLGLSSPSVFSDYGGGSCCVVAKKGDKIWLATNLHCLDVVDADTLDTFKLEVRFPSEKIRPVVRFAYPSGIRADDFLDIALLEVDASRLVEGVDYVVLPMFDDFESLKPGDDIVAVGSPAGGATGLLFDTRTFGKISAIRTSSPFMTDCKTIQLDADINPGNSGGPLFLNTGGSYCWIGMNTWGEVDSATGASLSGLNFAIHVSELLEAKYIWQRTTVEGFQKMMQDIME